MKFRLVIRSYDGTDRKGSPDSDTHYINGAIDSIDVMSDQLGDVDLYQSEHIILRTKEKRVISGYNYHMVESLANSCDNVSSPDWNQTVTDNKGNSRICKQFYSKPADSKTVTVKSWVDNLLLDESTFDITYIPTEYKDEGPRADCISAPPNDFVDLQTKLKSMVQKGLLFEQLVDIKGTYETNNTVFHYKGVWSSSIKKEQGVFVNRITFTLKYGNSESVTNTFSKTTESYLNDDNDTVLAALEEMVTAEITKLKAFLDQLASVNNGLVPSDIIGYYKTANKNYCYWLHYSVEVTNNTDSIECAIIYTLKYGTDDTSIVFSTNKKGYDLETMTPAQEEIIQWGTVEINKLLNFLDQQSGVKLVTVNTDGRQEIGAVSNDPGGKTLVITAHGTQQQISDYSLKGLLQSDSVDSFWIMKNGDPVFTEVHTFSGKGLLISDGRYFLTQDIDLGGESFTIDFFAYVDEAVPAEACLCDIYHSDHDIKLKILKETDSDTGDIITSIGLFIDNVLISQSKIDIPIVNVLNHYALVFQMSARTLFCFINGTMIGSPNFVLLKNTAKIYFNYDVTTQASVFQGVIDETRISTGLARWIPDHKFIDYDTSRIVDEAGAVWQMHDGEVRVAPPEQNRFGTGLQFSDKSYTTLNTPIVLGGSDFTIDCWYYLETDETETSLACTEGGIFTIEAKQDNTKVYDFGFHFIGDYKNRGLVDCIHGYIYVPKKTALTAHIPVTLHELHHMAMVYVNADDNVYLYHDGIKQSVIFKCKGAMSNPASFQLTVGAYLGGGTKGYLKGSVDEFRISAGIARWTDNFEVPAEPYEIDNFTKALLRTSNFDIKEDEEEFKIVNPNLIFNPPKEPYTTETVNVNEKENKDFYIPLAEFFDDDKFSVIKHVPSQTGVNKDGDFFEPIWENYDPDQLDISGDIRSVNTGVHYVTFTPCNDYVWSNGTVEGKVVVWTAQKNTISDYPYQEQPLTYNGNEQDINITGFDPETMVLSGEIKATDVNDISKPFYTAVVTPKSDYAWETGRSDPYEVKWIIEPYIVTKPVLNSISSLDYTYDGEEKEPFFIYDTDKINVTGTVKAIEPNVSNKNKTVLTDDYKITFSVKDKKNYAWAADDSEHNNDGTDDITFSWYIRRKQIDNFSIQNTSFVYNGNLQGPDITPSVWNDEEVIITEYEKDDVGDYTLQIQLVDITRYEWKDGTTNKKTINWSIRKAQSSVSLSKSSVTLTATTKQLIPEETLDINKTGTGIITVSDNPYVTTILEGNKLTVKGLQSTPKPITVTITVQEDINWLSSSCTLQISVIRGLEAFSWKEIAQMAHDGTLLTASYIGDTKTVTLQQTVVSEVTPEEDIDDVIVPTEIQTVKVKAILIGVDHNSVTEGSGKAHFLIGKDINGYDISLDSLYKMFTVNSNAGGWILSNLKLQMMRSGSGICFSDMFPSDLLEVLTPCLKWTDNIGGGLNESFYVTPVLEYITVPSEYEVFGKCTYSNSAESVKQQQYAYFFNSNSRIRKSLSGQTVNNWFLRSVDSTSREYVTVVSEKGVSTRAAANTTADITPVFTVSKKTEDIITIPDINTSVETLMHFDDPDDPFKDDCNSTFTIYNKATGQETVAEIATSPAKFGGALQFDGTIYAQQNIPIYLGDKDFTIDFWCYYDNRSSTVNGQQAYMFKLISSKTYIYSHRTAQTNGVQNIDKTRITTGIRAPLAESGTIKSGYQRTLKHSEEPIINTWVHVAIVYDFNRSTVFIYYNGRLSASTQSDEMDVLKFKIPYAPYYLTLGTDPGKQTCMIGAVDELRITNGLMRWQAPDWAYERKATLNDTDRQVFIPPVRAGETTENDVLHDQTSQGYIVQLSNTVRTKRFQVTQHTGRLHVVSAQPKIATAVLEDETVVISGVSEGITTVTVYTDDTDTTVGNVKIFKVICDKSTPYPALDECTPLQIRNIIRSGKAADAWTLGNTTAPIQITGTINGKTYDKQVRAILIGINHNSTVETEGKNSLHFVFQDIIEGPFQMYSQGSSYATGGWNLSDMRNTYCSQILQCMPLEWRNVISSVNKWTNNSNSGSDDLSDITVTTDKIWLLSPYEINGDDSSMNPYEHVKQEIYGYLQSTGSSVLTENVLTRSPSKTANAGFNVYVRKTSVDYSNLKIQPCFVISDTGEEERLTASQSTLSTVKNITYDGSMHYPVDEGVIKSESSSLLNNNYYSFSGDTVGLYAGNYTLQVSPAIGYLWNDGTKTPVTLSWEITPKEDILKSDKQALKLYYKNSYSDMITLTRNGTSELQLKFSNPGIVSYRIVNNTVTFNSEGTGQTTVTITSPAEGNYAECSTTITVTASKISALNTYTPSQIRSIVSAGQASYSWDIGDVTAPITVKGTFENYGTVNMTCYAYILGFDHNSETEGLNKVHFCLGRISVSGDTGLFKTEADINALSNNCDITFAALPADWQLVISGCNKQTGDINNKKYLWLLSQREVLGTDITTEKQYDYYKNGNSPIRYQDSIANAWFTRDITENVPVAISATGKSVTGTTGLFVPCFTVGQVRTSSNLTVSKNRVSVSVGATSSFTVNRLGTGKISVVSTNSSVATAVFDGTSVTVNGLKTGTVQIIVKVEETDIYGAMVKIVNVTVGSQQKTTASLSLSSNNVNITKDGTTVINVVYEGGTFSVNSQNDIIATATLMDNKITIKGITEGTTKITVKVTGDSLHTDIEKTVNITVSSTPVSLNSIPAVYSTITVKDGIVYNGNDYNIADYLNGYSEAYHVLTGDITAKNHNDVKDYAIIVSPKSGYQWNGGGTEDRTLYWNIEQANSMISGNTNIVLIKDMTESVAEDYRVTGDGVLSIESISDSSAITATIEDGILSVSSNCSVNTVVEIVLVTPATLNYKAAALAVNVSVHMSALDIIPEAYNMSSLTLTTNSVVYDENLSYSLTTVNNWIENFNSKYHQVSEVKNSNQDTVSNIQDADIYTIFVIPAEGYAWDNTGNVTTKKLLFTITRKDIGTDTALQTGLSETGIDSCYNGFAQTPVFDIQDMVDITVTAQVHADIYNQEDTMALLIPKDNYCWHDGTVTGKKFAWTVNRAKISSEDEPVEQTPLTYNGSKQKPAADNFIYDPNKMVFSAPAEQLNANNYSEEQGAQFIPTSDWCWNDGTTTVKKFAWSIAKKKINKPSASAFSKPYNETAQGPTISNNITETDNFVTVTGNNTLSEAWSESNQTGFSKTTDTTVKFTAVDAGRYQIVYSLKGNSDITNVIWNDETTDNVTISYDITRAEIPATEVPASGDPLVASFNIEQSGFVMQSPTFLHDTSPDKYTKEFEREGVPGTYDALFIPTKNYQWQTTVQSDITGPYIVRWAIDKAPGFVNVKYHDLDPADLTNNTYTTQVEITSCSGKITYSMEDEHVAQLSVDNDTYYLTVKAVGEGSSNILFTVAETDYFNETTVKIPVILTVVHETMSKKKPWNLVKNFLQHLIWYNSEDYYYYVLASAETTDAGTIIHPDVNTLIRPDDITATTIKAMDFALSKITNGKLKTVQTLVDIMKQLADSTEYTIEGVKECLQTNYNIDIDNTDRGSLFGYDIGVSDSQISDSDTVPEEGTVGNYPASTSTVIEGITVTWPTEVKTNDETRALTSKEKYIVKAMNTWWIPEPLKMINQYYGVNIYGPFVHPKANTLNVYFTDLPSDNTLAIANAKGYQFDGCKFEPVSDDIFTNIYGITDTATKAKYQYSLSGNFFYMTDMFIVVNPSYAERINQDKDGTIGTNEDASQAADLVIGHELIHAMMFISMRYHYLGYPKWFAESIAETLWGVDVRANALINLAGNSELLQKVFDGNITSEQVEYNYVFAYLMFRYLIKNYCK